MLGTAAIIEAVADRILALGVPNLVVDTVMRATSGAALASSRAISRGGTITGEHGMGCVRKEFLSLALSQAEIDLLVRIKRAFDPNMILNPGKILPDGSCGP